MCNENPEEGGRSVTNSTGKPRNFVTTELISYQNTTVENGSSFNSHQLNCSTSSMADYKSAGFSGNHGGKSVPGIGGLTEVCGVWCKINCVLGPFSEISISFIPCLKRAQVVCCASCPALGRRKLIWLCRVQRLPLKYGVKCQAWSDAG